MQFREFTDWGAERPRCSLRKSGALGFSRAAVKQLHLRKGFARVFFAEEEQVVGIKLIGSEGKDGAVPVVMRKNDVFIPTRAMFNKYHVDYSEAKSFEPRWDDEYQMILVDLNAPLRRGKNKKGANGSSGHGVFEQAADLTTQP